MIRKQDSNLKMSIGIVKDNADPDKEGKLKVFIPAVDSRDYEVEDLPWARYVSPFGGTTANIKVGRDEDELSGVSTYGFWAIPKNGAQVIVGFLEGDETTRMWMGCVFMPNMHGNFPQGVNGIMSNEDETGVYGQHEIKHLVDNLNEAGHGESDLNFKTIGAYEKAASDYAPKPLEADKSDSQLLTWSSPGRHYILFSDDPTHCRVRIRSTAGAQILIDDTNERIYVSTARGRNYVELDEGSGAINIYSANKINLHGENDINIRSDQNVNIVAGKRVNIVSEQRGIKLEARMGINMISQENDVKITASRSIHLKTLGGGNSGGVGESESCVQAPYAGEAIGLIRDHPEDAGSGSSGIFLNAVDGIDGLAGQGVKFTAGASIDIKAGANINNDAGGSCGIKAAAIPTTAGSLGWFDVDTHGDFGQDQSHNNAGPAAAADPATPVSVESIPPRMVIPMHESWDRSTVDADCPPTRNSNYIG